jgi:hypothetical protein
MAVSASSRNGSAVFSSGSPSTARRSKSSLPTGGDAGSSTAGGSLSSSENRGLSMAVSISSRDRSVSAGSCVNVSRSRSSEGGVSKAVVMAPGGGSGAASGSTGSCVEASCSGAVGDAVSSTAGGGIRPASRSWSRMLLKAVSTSLRGGAGVFFSGFSSTVRRSKKSSPARGDTTGGGMSLFMTMIDSPHLRQRMRAPFPVILDSSNLKRVRQA